MAQANPFEAMQGARNALDGYWTDRTMTRAGRAYSGGDPQGAANALAEGGMVAEAASLEGATARRDATQAEAEREAMASRADFLLRGVQMLRQIPYERRREAFGQLAPALQQMLPPEVVQQLSAADMTDQALNAFATSLGAEAERLQLFNTRQGVVGVNPRTGDANMLFEAPDDPTAPPGYRWTDDNNLEAIPGGPADPRVVGARAAAGRAPRGGGGGQRQPSGQGQPAPARTSRPWERFR